MTFPLVGESFGDLSQQRNRIFERALAQQNADRAYLTNRQDREEELAIRAREMMARDALNAAQQQESNFRFNIGLADRERARADQIAAQQAALQERRFQFGKQLEQDRARMAFEKERLQAREEDGPSVEEEAMLYTSQLEPVVSQLEQAAAERAARESYLASVAENADRAKLVRTPGATKFTFRTPTTGSPVRPEAFDNALKEAQKKLAEAARAEQKLKSAYERNLSNLENLGLRRGFKVDRTGQRIVTPTGEFRFGAGVTTEPTTTGNQADVVVGRDGIPRNPNGQPMIQRTASEAPQAERPEFSEPTAFEAPRSYTPPPVTYGRSAAQVRGGYDIERSRGALPWLGRGVVNSMAILPARLAAQTPTTVGGAALEAGRAVSDFLIMPPVGSEAYSKLMEQRARENRNMQWLQRKADELTPDYL